MLNFFHGVAQKIFAGFGMVIAMAGGMFTAPRVITITPQVKQLASIEEAVAPVIVETSTVQTATSTSVSSTIALSTSTPKEEPKKTAPTSSIKTTVTVQKTTPPSAPKPVPPPPQPAPKPPTPAPKTVSGPVTAQSLLDATTLQLKQKYNGTYAVMLQTNIGNLTWDLATATLGGSGSIPGFKPSFSCDPSPEMPDENAIDRQPSFQMRSSYRCTISLAALTGTDRRVQSKQFPFQTGGGQVSVATAATINPLLKDGKNSGGFVFRNQDPETVIVTGVKLDISFGALNTSPIPPVLRLLDATSDKTLAEYDLSNLPQEGSNELVHAKNGLELPLSFSLKPGQEKMLAVDIIAVQKIRSNGLDPNINITLRGVTLDHSDVKLTLNSPKLSWMCIVPTSAFDPNATSGPFMTGQACRE